jgi:hypothetical protein
MRPFKAPRIGICLKRCATGGEPGMSTGMTQQDRSIVTEAFNAAETRRGEPWRDDRRFLGATLCFTVRSLSWRPFFSEDGKCNSLCRLGQPTREMRAAQTAHRARATSRRLLRTAKTPSRGSPFFLDVVTCSGHVSNRHLERFSDAGSWPCAAIKTGLLGCHQSRMQTSFGEFR